MASFSIHIAAANEYLKKNNIDNPELFMDGVVDVDLTDDRFKSHYSNTNDTSNLEYYLDNKVNIKKYLEENEVKSDYERGYLFHLLTDYYFYTSFFDKGFISNIGFSEFKSILYHDYNSINEYMKEKYGVVYSDRIKKYDASNSDEPIILKKEQLSAFVEKMGNIDLEVYYKDELGVEYKKDYV